MVRGAAATSSHSKRWNGCKGICTEDMETAEVGELEQRRGVVPKAKQLIHLKVLNRGPHRRAAGGDEPVQVGEVVHTDDVGTVQNIHGVFIQ